DRRSLGMRWRSAGGHRSSSVRSSTAGGPRGPPRIHRAAPSLKAPRGGRHRVPSAAAFQTQSAPEFPMPTKRHPPRIPVLAAAPAVAGPQEDARALNAVRVLTDIQAIPESAIPDKLFDEGRAIVVVPDTIKAGLVIGGRRGHGLMSVKNPDGTWSNPSFVK